jgi:hypothetical protein
MPRTLGNMRTPVKQFLSEELSPTVLQQTLHLVKKTPQFSAAIVASN